MPMLFIMEVLSYNTISWATHALALVLNLIFTFVVKCGPFYQFGPHADLNPQTLYKNLKKGAGVSNAVLSFSENSFLGVKASLIGNLTWLTTSMYCSVS